MITKRRKKGRDDDGKGMDAGKTDRRMDGDENKGKERERKKQ